MQAYLHGDKVLIKAQYEDREVMKAVGDYRWNKELKMWEYPLKKLPELIKYLNLSYGANVRDTYLKLVALEDKRIATVNLADSIKQDPKQLECVLQNQPIPDISKLYTYQKQAFCISMMFDSYALFMETGTGKTLVAIKLIELRKTPTLIVCPLSVISSVWKSEVAKWAPQLKFINLWEVSKTLREMYIPTGFDVYAINFESFKKIKDPHKYFQFIIVDESSKMKSPKTQITKAIVETRSLVKYKIIMSGLPAPNDLLEYWGQFAFINEMLLGDNFYRFRNIFFNAGGYGDFQYFPKRGAKEAIMSKIAQQAFFIKKSECLDLPERVFEIRNITLDEIQARVYNEMLKLNITEFKNHTTLAMNELAKIMKLRQITAGFTITTEGLPVKVSDTKLNVLKDFIDDELPPDEQAIIWCQFHWEINTLAEFFGNEAVALYGEINQAQKDENIKAFQQKKARFLIAHPKSGGMGLTFVNCSYMIWFSISYSQEEHAQANDRIYRIGQKNNCTYIYILAKDTIDEVIYKALRKKKNLAESCLEMLKGVKQNNGERDDS